MQQNNKGPWRGGPRKQREHKLNDEIYFPEVRVSAEGIASKIVSSQEAMSMAKQLGLDLILIAPQAVPPVCLIQDYGKFMYNKKKKDDSNKPNKVQTKELRLTPNTDEHDLAFKTRHAINWLKDGDRIQASVFFKGRAIVFKEQGELVLLKLATALEEFGKIESMPKMEGKRMYMSISPKPKSSGKPKKEDGESPVVTN